MNAEFFVLAFTAALNAEFLSVDLILIANSRPRAMFAWLLRVLQHPRLGLAFGVGVICGLPGAVYLTALHNLVTGNWSSATRVAGVFVFVIIDFLLIIVPWLLLAISPEDTAAALRRTHPWLGGHIVQVTAGICLLLGAYLAISGLVHLL